MKKKAAARAKHPKVKAKRPTKKAAKTLFKKTGIFGFAGFNPPDDPPGLDRPPKRRRRQRL